MIHIAVYTRSAVKSPESIEAQRRTVDHALSRAGFMKNAVVEYYSDNGASGLSTERPGLQQLLADAAKGKFQWLLVDEWHRLSRCPTKLFSIWEQLLAHRIAYLTAQDLEVLC